MATLREKHAATFKAADEMYRGKEQEYLEAVAFWKRAAPYERAAAALTVGNLQRELAGADDARQSVKYPHRFIQKQELMRTVIDADTRDMRKIPHPVFVQQGMTTDAVDRTISL